MPPAAYRVLWLGDPRALPVGGWPVDAGLSYALSGQSLPDATRCGPRRSGPGRTAAVGLQLALDGNTVHLGRLLAPLGVRYVVVIDGINPVGSEVASVNAPPPVGLQRSLLDQDDLQAVPGQVGVQVYQNAETLPVTAQRARPPLPTGPIWSFPTAADVQGWRPVLTPLAHRTAPPAPSPRARSTRGTPRPVISPWRSVATPSPAGRRSAGPANTPQPPRDRPRWPFTVSPSCPWSCWWSWRAGWCWPRRCWVGGAGGARRNRRTDAGTDAAGTVSPAAHREPRRWVVLVVVLVVIVGVAILARSTASSSSRRLVARSRRHRQRAAG